jgi:hypothetical protein
MVLLGTVEPGIPGAVWAAIGSILTALLAGVTAMIVKVMRENAKSRKDALDGHESIRKTTLGEAFEIIESLKRDREKDRDRLDKVETESDKNARAHADCEKDRAKFEAYATERINELEAALEGAGIRYRRRGLSDGSGHHDPLRPGSTERKEGGGPNAPGSS